MADRAQDPSMATYPPELLDAADLLLRPHTTQQALSLLAEVARGIEADLDTSYQACDGCGSRRYTDWEARQASDLLLGAIGRLEKAAGLIRAGSQHGAANGG